MYTVRLPRQPISEYTDGNTWSSAGNEFADTDAGTGHFAVVVSDNEYNSNRSGLIVVPLSSSPTYENKPMCVRLRIKSVVAYAICDQVRYVDKRRCGPLYGSLFDIEGKPLMEFGWIENKIRSLLLL